MIRLDGVDWNEPTFRFKLDGQILSTGQVSLFRTLDDVGRWKPVVSANLAAETTMARVPPIPRGNYWLLWDRVSGSGWPHFWSAEKVSSVPLSTSPHEVELREWELVGQCLSEGGILGKKTLEYLIGGSVYRTVRTDSDGHIHLKNLPPMPARLRYAGKELDVEPDQQPAKPRKFDY